MVMKNVLTLLFIIGFNFVFSQYDEKDKDLLNRVVQIRQNHILNKKEGVFWKEYNHTILSSDVEKITKLVDTIWRNKKKGLYKIDSSSYKLKQFNINQHFYQAERNVSHERLNYKHRSIITNYKMGGFKNPIYESLALKLYSHSIFDDDFYFMHVAHLHPLSERGLKKYQFVISEQTENQYTISFKNPKKMDIYGWFLIDKLTLQIKEATIEKSGFLSVITQYKNVYDHELNQWLPFETTLEIKKGHRDDDFKIFGKVVHMKDGHEKIFFSDHLYLQSTSNYKDFEFKKIKQNKKRYVSIDFDIDDDENFRRNESVFSIDIRNEYTYNTLDSLSYINKIEKRIEIARKVYEGYYPIEKIDINLKRLINYNNYEGFRLGLGLQTNQNFLKNFQTSGYFGYGLQDQKMKYYFKQAMRIDIFSDSWLSVAYQDDIQEIGSTKFQTDYNRLIFLNLRPLNMTTFYAERHVKAELKTKIIPKTQTVAGLTYAKINPLFDYTFLHRDKLFDTYNISTISLSSRWMPFSKFMQTPDEKLVYKHGYPTVTLQFTQSLSGFTKNDFNYQKFDFKTEFRKKFWNNNELKYFFQSGVVFGSAPITHLYSVFPNSGNKPEIIQRFDISGKNNFETMRRNEFFSDRFIFSEIIYDMPLKIGRSFNPIVSLVNRYGTGNMSEKEKHLDIIFDTIEKGYWESGVELLNLYNWFGLSGFYRHGAYQLPTFKENISIKLNFRIVI